LASEGEEKSQEQQDSKADIRPDVWESGEYHNVWHVIRKSRTNKYKILIEWLNVER
jgi:hypothetical protein